jgi:hypothetical protein
MFARSKIPEHGRIGYETLVQKAESRIQYSSKVCIAGIRYLLLIPSAIDGAPTNVVVTKFPTWSTIEITQYLIANTHVRRLRRASDELSVLMSLMRTSAIARDTCNRIQMIVPIRNMRSLKPRP